MTYTFHWFSEQVGLAGDLGSTNDVLIPLVVLIIEVRSRKVVSRTMTKFTLGEYRMEVRADYVSNTTTPGFNKNSKFELGGDNEVLSDDIVLSDDERQESKSTNHLHDNPNRFFKTYFNAQERNNIYAFEIGQECFDKPKLKIYGHNISELNDISVSNDEEKELLNEGVCKSEKFEVIRYSLGTNEEYIAVNTCEYNTWKRTDGIVSSVYHEIFRKKDQG
ncbi:hypothetical protein Tco_0337178 [Tanacetum coccineum]